MEYRASVADDGSRLIKAYHAVWGIPDDYGTVWMKGCFSKSIQERGPESKSFQKIIILAFHDQSDPIGLPSVLKEDDYGLYAEYTPDEGVYSADRIVRQVNSGTINQFSFGAMYLWDKMEYDDDTDMIIIKESELFELSPVSLGSQSETHAVRGWKDFDKGLLEIQDEWDVFVKSVPRKQQLELRQLILRHISLIESKPLEPRRTALSKNNKPKKPEIDYNFLTQNLQ